VLYIQVRKIYSFSLKYSFFYPSFLPTFELMIMNVDVRRGGLTLCGVGAQAHSSALIFFVIVVIFLIIIAARVH
jgi:hypothetical protein